MNQRHPAVERIMRFFSFDHLPPVLQAISRPFAVLATEVADRAPEDAETTVALRKLLEAKDAAVRAGMASQPASDVAEPPSANPPAVGRTLDDHEIHQALDAAARVARFEVEAVDGGEILRWTDTDGDAYVATLNDEGDVHVTQGGKAGPTVRYADFPAWVERMFGLGAD